MGYIHLLTGVVLKKLYRVYLLETTILVNSLYEKSVLEH